MSSSSQEAPLESVMTDEHIGDFDKWYKKLSDAVAADGFSKAWKRYFPEIAHVHRSKSYDATMLGQQMIDLMSKDAELRKEIDNLPPHEARELSDYLLHGEGERDKSDSPLHDDYKSWLSQQISQAAGSSEAMEEDGSPVNCLTNEVFKNWGRTVENVPAVTFFPMTKVGICNVVKWARSKNRRVRVAAYRHTWGETFSSNGEVLVSILSLESATVLPAKHPPINPRNQLQGIQLVGEPFDEGGVRKHLCKIGTATTNEQFRQWAIDRWSRKKNGEDVDVWTFPINVIMVENTFGGTNAMLCHGSGWQTKTLSDLVTALEFVDCNGELQTVDDPDLIKAAGGCFGLLGIVTSITLKLDEMTYAVLEPSKQPVPLTIPPVDLNLANVPSQISTKGITQQQLQDSRNRFVESCENDYYVEWFWFPYQEECWINTWKNDGKLNDSVEYPSPAETLLQETQEYAAQIANETIFKYLSGKTQADLLAGAAMSFLPDNVSIKTPLIDALHFRRGIQNMRVLDMEFEIPIPGRKDDPGQPDWTICQHAWWAVIDEIYNRKDAPMRIAMEMRITGHSNMVMASQYGNQLGTCSIEVLTTPNTPPAEWLQFMQDITDVWTSFKDSLGNTLNARPHWAKQWQGLTIKGKPVKQHLKDVAFVERIPEFTSALQAIAKSQGYSLNEMRSLFSNPLYDDLIFDVVDKTGSMIQVLNSGGYVARFSVTYNLDGAPQRSESHDFLLNQVRTVAIPPRATNIKLKVEKAVFIGTWRDIFAKEFAAPVSKCYKVWGTTISSNYAEVDC
jgi:hypothetical protein